MEKTTKVNYFSSIQKWSDFEIDRFMMEDIEEDCIKMAKEGIEKDD